MLFLHCNSAWGDQLTAYNGQAITYDANGNPISYYNGATFEWQGRQLVGAAYNSNTYTYTYDTNGIRTSRTKHLSDGTTKVTNYIYNGNLLVSEETGGNVTMYFYDPSGSPIGFQFHAADYAAGVWDTYHYVKNLQGDIIKVLNSSGNCMVSYSYDEYGVPTVDITKDTKGVRDINHLMYRGYYYDFESYNSNGFTGGLELYYLGSRYYDANIGRFISPDDISYLGANGDLNAYNLYAYCSNNPIMYSDPSGHSWESFWSDIGNWFKEHWVEVVVGSAFIVGGAAVTALTCGAGTTAWAAFGSALLSSATQAGISVATGIGVNGIVNVATGNDFFDNVGDTIASSYMWGGILSGGAQILGGGFRILRAKTGYTGINTNNVGLASPDKLYYDRAGMTLLRLGNRNGSKIALDFGRYGIHAHLFSNLHTPMIPIIVGLMEMF